MREGFRGVREIVMKFIDTTPYSMIRKKNEIDFKYK